MKLLHNIGISPSNNPSVASNYNTLDEILQCDEPLSFDGVYKSVYENRVALKDKDVTLFVMGQYVGKDNSFDTGMPPEEYCTWKEIAEMKDMGFKIGWHTWSHPNLTEIPLYIAKREMDWRNKGVPIEMEEFAYPHGAFNERLMLISQEIGYKRAWSVTQGNDNEMSLRRTYL